MTTESGSCVPWMVLLAGLNLRAVVSGGPQLVT